MTKQKQKVGRSKTDPKYIQKKYLSPKILISFSYSKMAYKETPSDSILCDRSVKCHSLAEIKSEQKANISIAMYEKELQQ